MTTTLVDLKRSAAAEPRVNHSVIKAQLQSKERKELGDILVTMARAKKKRRPTVSR